MLALGGEIDAMVEIARDYVGRAAHHRLERHRAALELDYVDIDTGLFEFAELVRQHGRQVAQAARATDGERDFRLRRCRTGHQAGRQNEHGQRRCETTE